MNLIQNKIEYKEAEILRDETTISNQYENGFKILTQCGHVFHLYEETLYHIVHEINTTVEKSTVIDTSVYEKVLEVDVSEDGFLCYIDLTFVDVSITCNFALNISDMYMYNDVYLHEEAVKTRVENTTFQPLSNHNTGGVAC